MTALIAQTFPWRRAVDAATGLGHLEHVATIRNSTVDCRKSILILDEDRNRAETRAARLRLAGVEVQCSATPDEAIAWLKENSSDLVLIDARKRRYGLGAFCDSVRRVNPAQRMAFYVDGPKLISWSVPAVAAPKNGCSDLAAELKAMIGTPQAPRTGSLLDASWHISINRWMAGLKRRQGALPPD